MHYFFFRTPEFTRSPQDRPTSSWVNEAVSRQVSESVRRTTIQTVTESIRQVAWRHITPLANRRVSHKGSPWIRKPGTYSNQAPTNGTYLTAKSPVVMKSTSFCDVFNSCILSEVMHDPRIRHRLFPHKALSNLSVRWKQSLFSARRGLNVRIL